MGKKTNLLIIATTLLLSGCGMNEPEWYDAQTKIFTSDEGFYKVMFPDKPTRTTFDEYGKVHIYAWEWNGPDLKLLTTYRNDDFDESQYATTLARVANVCLEKFELIETLRTPYVVGNAHGLDIQGKSQKSDDIFLLRIFSDVSCHVDHIMLVQGKPEAVNGPEAKKFFDSYVTHDINRAKKNRG